VWQPLTSSDRRILRPDVDQWRKDIEALYEAVKTGGSHYRQQGAQSEPSNSDRGNGASGDGNRAGDDGSMVLLASSQ
jgi:hypothetical protein